jgi:hypothetical protein
MIAYSLAEEAISIITVWVCVCEEISCINDRNHASKPQRYNILRANATIRFKDY